MKNKKVVQITFDSEEAAEEFAIWLCEHGEQDYWQWMENSDPDGEFTASNFKYHTGNNFDWTNIKATCGRMDKE